jgi:predicted cupin superfamily sugar epimerase
MASITHPRDAAVQRAVLIAGPHRMLRMDAAELHARRSLEAQPSAGAARWIARLELAPHPEGGWYRQTYRSPLMLPSAALPAYGGDRAAATTIYFLLSGDEFSALHRLRSDEGWHFYAGSPLAVHVINPKGAYRQILLGSDPDAGQAFQAVVPGGCWFGSSLLHPGTYALAGCTVAPGFEFADFEMANRRELVSLYPEHRDIITRLTREP